MVNLTACQLTPGYICESVSVMFFFLLTIGHVHFLPLEVFYFMLDIIHKMKQKLQMKSPTIKSTVFSLLGREHTGNGHFGVIRG